MLIQFVVENYMSFKNEAVLNMTATTDSSHKNHVTHDEQGKKTSVLRAAALYGANASGKSNLVKAISFARDFIIYGTRPEISIPVVPFKFDPETTEKPSKFEFIIKHEGVLYTYGFAADEHRVIEEWLFAQPDKREVSFFKRTTDEKGQAKVIIGSHLAPKGSKRAEFLEYIAQGTRPNQLFLTECHEKNVEQIKPLMLWFRNCLTVLWPNQFARSRCFPPLYNFPELLHEQYSQEILATRLDEELELKEFISHFLRTVMKDIQSIYVYKFETASSKNPLLKAISKEEKEGVDNKDINKDEEKVIQRMLFTIHKCKKKQKDDADFSLLALREESDGTQRLIEMLPVIYDALTKGKVFIIDELERSLHPLLSRLFLQTFLDTEPFGGQIIFATHETTLMDLDLLRRDEIWFVEKDEEESSRIYSLAEFRVRNDLKIDKGYLHGRFGAIPFFGDASKLGIETKA